jgi:hypothetical protein
MKVMDRVWLALLVIGLAAAFAYLISMAIYVSGVESKPAVLSPLTTTSTMPEDTDRLESEAYKVCQQYANLDLSGMVKMCKMVGYQE